MKQNLQEISVLCCLLSFLLLGCTQELEIQLNRGFLVLSFEDVFALVKENTWDTIKQHNTVK